MYTVTIFLIISAKTNVEEIFIKETVAKVNTACYGTPTLECTEHKLICTEPLGISITNITFGYRRECSKTGVANCPGNTTCCREEIGDCFTPYNQTLLSQLQQTCNRRSTCTRNIENGLNESSSYCFNGSPIFHSYSKITYQCVINATSSTSQTTTESTPPSTPEPATETTSTSSTTGTTSPSSTTETTSPSSSPQITAGTTPPSSTPEPTTETTSTSSTTATTSPSSSPRTLAGTTLPMTVSTKLTSVQTSISPINRHDKDVGDIVGGIVGVIVVIGIVGAAIYFIKRRKADKIPSKDIAFNPDDSNRRYQTDSTPPRKTATPVYHELENTTNTSRPASAKLTPGDNYDYVGGDNHVKHATGNDNYNHIGISGVTSDDEYHHLKGTNSKKSSVPDSNYNHIGSFSTAEDNYQHIGDNKTRIITDDTYNHIDGHDNTGLDSDHYHHIGGSHEHQVVTDGTYNHIGGDHNEVLGNDDYHHIGNGNTQPIITHWEYSHICGADT